VDAILAHLGRRYPDIGLQLRRARRAGDWYRGEGPSLAVPGGLALQLEGDSGEVLFGQDFTVALELVHAAAAILLAPGALRAPEEALQSISRFQAGLLAENVRIAAAARIATRGFPSWNAFMRVWLLWSISSALALKKVRLDAVRSGDWSAASKFDAGIGWFDLAPGIADVLHRSVELVEMIETNGALPSQAAARIFSLMSRPRVIPPLFKFGDPRARRYRLNLFSRLKLMCWVFTIGPREYRGMLTADNITAVPAENVMN
jgi:tetracycline 7-halogenase / FADH2 O2-dependent halogenase